MSTIDLLMRELLDDWGYLPAPPEEIDSPYFPDDY